MDLEIITLGKPHREKQISYDIVYKWNLKKMIQMNLYTKQIDSQTWKTKL